MITSIIITSCSEQESLLVSTRRIVNFPKYINPNLKIGSLGELAQIEVEIIVKDGSPKMISDEIEEKVFEVDGHNISMFSYKKTTFIDDSNSSSNIELRTPGFKYGYVYDGGSCFVYCLYFENPNGSIVPWSCCGDSAGNCAGLDPICAGPGQAWA